MASFISAMRAGAKFIERRDDDGFDRLSNRYSVGILMTCIAFITIKSFTGEPIACAGPMELSIGQRKFLEGTCWSSGTYYVDPKDQLVVTHPPGGWKQGGKSIYQNEVKYYQFVPMILAGICVFFFLPAQIWSWSSRVGGYDIQAIVEATKGTTNINPEVRDKTVMYLVSQMDRLIGYRRPFASKSVKHKINNAARIGKRHGAYLFYMYLISKVLYMVNAIGLVYLIDQFLGRNGYQYYGIEVMQKLAHPDFEGTERFPYAVLCDYWMRKLGQNSHRYTVHCVLSINIFNEKIFIFLWFWLIFVACMSALGLILWMFTAFKSVNRRFVLKYLRIMGRGKKESMEVMDDFISDYLRLDGCFCLRVIIKNTNDAVGGEILAACWDHYLHARQPSSIDSTIDNPIINRRADDEVSV